MQDANGCLKKIMLLSLCLGFSACVTSSDLVKMQEQIEQLLAQQSAELNLLRDENKKIWRNLRCSDPQLSDFMAEAEQCQRGQCPQRNIDGVLEFMSTQKHVLIRLRPNQSVTEISPIRIAQLRDMLDPRQLTSLSRIVMLSMRVNLNRGEPADLAEKQADAMFFYIRRTLQLASSTARIGPFSVNCQNEVQPSDLYARRFSADRATLGEPNSKDPQVVLWIFKVDC